VFESLTAPVFLCGAGVDGAGAEAAGAALLEGDPVSAAERLAAHVSGRAAWRAT
jgi:hypothetical protein